MLGSMPPRTGGPPPPLLAAATFGRCGFPARAAQSGGSRATWARRGGLRFAVTHAGGVAPELLEGVVPPCEPCAAGRDGPSDARTQSGAFGGSSAAMLGSMAGGFARGVPPGGRRAANSGGRAGDAVGMSESLDRRVGRIERGDATDCDDERSILRFGRPGAVFPLMYYGDA